MIRTENHFVWNFTILMGYLALGFSVGMLLGMTMGNTILGHLGSIFVHSGVAHITGNITAIMIVAVGLSAFAHPSEFVAILLSTTIVNVVHGMTYAPGHGLSLVVFALQAALLVYCLAVPYELRQFSRFEGIALVVSAIVIGLVIWGEVESQLLHDWAVVFENQAVMIDFPGYTRGSSVAHVTGFLWGLIAAIGARTIRYVVLDIE